MGLSFLQKEAQKIDSKPFKICMMEFSFDGEVL